MRLQFTHAAGSAFAKAWVVACERLATKIGDVVLVVAHGQKSANTDKPNADVFGAKIASVRPQRIRWCPRFYDFALTNQQAMPRRRCPRLASKQANTSFTA